MNNFPLVMLGSKHSQVGEVAREFLAMGLDMSFKIRLATLQDIPALVELIAESVRSLSAPYYAQTQTESALTHIFGIDTQLILDGTYFVVEASEETSEQRSEVVGCGGWSKRKTLFGGDQAKTGNVDNLLKPSSDAARLRAFYVHPKWARKGIGALIIRTCEAAARAERFTRLELIATLPGEPLYSASGYVIIAPFEIPLPGNDSLPGFRMAKDIA